MDHSRNEKTPFPNARQLPSKRVSLFLQFRMVVSVSQVPQHRKRLTNMENQMIVSLMGKEEGWPITFITSKVRYNGHRKKKNTAPGRSIAIYGLYRFIVHPKYFVVSDRLQSPGHFFISNWQLPYLEDASNVSSVRWYIYLKSRLLK